MSDETSARDPIGEDARIDLAARGECLGIRNARDEEQDSESRAEDRHQARLHEVPALPAGAMVVGGAAGGGDGGPPTSGSGRKSTTLKPKGFQRRTCGSVDGVA